MGGLTALCLCAPVHAQTVTVYTTEASYDAAIPAGSISTVEDFASITADSNVTQTTPTTWNGFSLLASGNAGAYGQSRYCVNLDTSSCLSYNSAMPAIKGIKAAFAQSSFYGNGQLTFTPTNPAFSIGMSNIDWNDGTQRSAIQINFSNGGSFVYSQPTQPYNSPPQFTGFKLDATSIAAGINISSLRWYGTFQSELVGIWNVRTSAPNPLVVTSTADTDTIGTLRYAINWSNSNPGADTISFDIAGTGPHTITTTSGLPTITDAGTTINGLSQTGAACGQLSDGTPHNLQIFINGNGTAGHGFRITGANATISGMAVGNFQDKGVFVSNTNNALIECNYFGVEPDGSTASPLVISAISGANQFDSTTNSVARNNLFSGNNDDAEDIGLIIGPNASDITIEGNVIGLNANGTAALANGATGLRINTSSQVTVGGTTAAQRNIISGNGADGILLERSNNVYLLGNYIGVASNGTISIGNGDDGLDIDDADNITIGGTTAAARNIISGNDDEGIDVKNGSSNIVIQGNYVGTDAGGTLNRGNSGAGVQINGSAAHLVGDGSASGANIIAFSGGDGIRIIGSSTQVAILANAIFSNGVGDGGDNGIDIEDDGVTANDGNDSDSGANDRLNFPEFVAVEAEGSASLAYNFNLDVPANGLGYRIDFFKNSTPDSSNYGQGEIWLGSTNVSHAGGDLNFSGLLTTNSTINVGDRIAATATRITATGYDITSEFNLNGTTVQRQGLAVTISSTVYDLQGIGALSIPGNDQLVSVNVVNQSGLPTSSDSIELILSVPPEANFYFDDVDDAGPENNPVAFDVSNAPGLTFTYANDVRYSNNPVQPAFADCNYTPVSTYDPAVTFICINPKGVLPASDPDPSFALQFRQRTP